MALLSRREFLKLVGLGPTVGLAPGPLPSAPRGTVRLTVNGRPLRLRPGPRVSLLDFLRTDLNLRGAKYGCGTGVCGACTVLINQRPIRSCVVNLAHLDGFRVTTIEGLGGPGVLDPIQKTFADLSVFQCGYCAPGFVLTARALLNHHPYPTEAQVRETLYGNLCRCTGYQRIVNAVRVVNDPQLRSLLFPRKIFGVVSTVQDVLAEPKVTGRLAYARDRHLPGQLFAQVVWSAHPHARILGINIAAARRVPGVVRVLTHRDVPGRKTFGSMVADQPVLARDRVRFQGDALAVVVAESLGAARRGAARVAIDYRPLPGLFTPKESLAPGAPRLTAKGNVCAASHYLKGDLAKGRARAKVVVKQTYATPFVEHAYLETESCLTYVDRGNVLRVVSASQSPHSYQSQIAAICQLPPEKVQMETTVAGGAFGAKADLSIQHLCALATLVTGRPVRLDLTREESLRASVKRHPFTIECETGADETGRLTHARVRALADAGAYTSATPAVADNAAVFATGPYQVDHLDVKVTAAFTNNPTCGAMRGFGVPQVCLAMERQMDELAARLGLDPLEMRLKNALDQGKVSQWGQVMGPGVGVKACLKALQKATRGAKHTAARDFSLKPGERVGLGLAAGYKNTSFPTNWPPNMNLGRAEVTYALNRHGRFVVFVGGSELGQGLVTVLTEIAAQGLGVPAERIRIVFGSTRRTRAPIQTTSSQQTFLTGGAVLDAAPRFSSLLLRAAAKVWPAEADRLSLGPDGLEAAGRKIASYPEVAWRCALAGHRLRRSYTYEPPVKTIAAPHRVRRVGPDRAILPSLGYAAQAALVAVHQRTGQVRVLQVFAAQDTGQTMFRAGAEGQIEGGVMMGLGWCLKEDLRIEQGRVVTDNLDTYFVPRTEDTPVIVPLIVEVPDPLGPLGAKGIGEVPVLPTAPAILNAIRDAVGVSLTRLPVSTAELKRKMRGAGS